MTDLSTRNRNIKYQTSVPLISDEISTHKTFMDTLGRTCLKLTAMNMIDESRDEDLFVSLAFRQIPLLIKFRTDEAS